MGIKGLMKLINDYAPAAIKQREIDYFFGRIVAIDASMSLYQFLIQIRSGPEGEVLTNEAGEVTSHLQGMFYRTIRMLDNGLKPVFVFDGKPPELKGGELAKRTAKRDEAEEGKKQAEADEDQEEINKYKKRLVKVTKEHNAETRQLLNLMGVPIVESPGEAEAQCAAMTKAGVIHAAATEDMDALTFGTPLLLRHLTSPAGKKEPILEIHLDVILKEMELTMEQFIDVCILCGCDYTVSIRGVGPQTALKLVKEYGNMDGVLKHMAKDKDKYKVGDDFQPKESALLFTQPEVTPPSEIKLEWKDPDEAGLIQFLVTEKGFNLERVQGALTRLKKARGKASQQRIEGFFTKAAPGGETFEKPNAKRKEPAAAAAGSKKKGLQKKAKTTNGKDAKPASAVSKKKK